MRRVPQPARWTRSGIDDCVVAFAAPLPPIALDDAHPLRRRDQESLVALARKNLAQFYWIERNAGIALLCKPLSHGTLGESNDPFGRLPKRR